MSCGANLGIQWLINKVLKILIKAILVLFIAINRTALLHDLINL